MVLEDGEEHGCKPGVVNPKKTNIGNPFIQSITLRKITLLNAIDLQNLIIPVLRNIDSLKEN